LTGPRPFLDRLYGTTLEEGKDRWLEGIWQRFKSWISAGSSEKRRELVEEVVSEGSAHSPSNRKGLLAGTFKGTLDSHQERISISRTVCRLQLQCLNHAWNLVVTNVTCARS
jgi:hypothetical protein